MQLCRSVVLLMSLSETHKGQHWSFLSRVFPPHYDNLELSLCSLDVRRILKSIHWKIWVLEKRQACCLFLRVCTWRCTPVWVASANCGPGLRSVGLGGVPALTGMNLLVFLPGMWLLLACNAISLGPVWTLEWALCRKLIFFSPLANLHLFTLLGSFSSVWTNSC